VTRRGRGDGGQAAVELVLVLPLLLVVALAALQVVLVARDQVLVVHAAREGARQAAVSADDASVTRRAAGATALEPERLTTGITRRGEDVTVSATYRSPTRVPLVGAMVGDVRLAASVTMRDERP
jgi:Flp pilus assembly protein TadG